MKTNEEIKFETTEYWYEDHEYLAADRIKSDPKLAEQEKEVPYYEQLISRHTKRNDHFVDYSGGLMGI